MRIVLSSMTALGESSSYMLLRLARENRKVSHCSPLAHVTSMHHASKRVRYVWQLTKYGRSERLRVADDAQSNHRPDPKDTSIPRGAPDSTVKWLIVRTWRIIAVQMAAPTSRNVAAKAANTEAAIYVRVDWRIPLIKARKTQRVPTKMR